MKKLYTDNQFEQENKKFIFELECYQCGNSFKKTKSQILRSLKNPRSEFKYCSIKCVGKSKTKAKEIACRNCGKLFSKTAAEIKRFPNHFCSRSHAVSYNNKHKSKGIRRSKLEMWLEDQLTNLYPDLDILFNDKFTINSELDIYIPSLNIAIELNGIFHYEPIFGKDKLDKIQNNDKNKFKLCIDAKINLCIIDTSNQSSFTPQTSLRYLLIITDIIEFN